MGIASGSRFYFVHICISYKKNSVAIEQSIKRGKSVITITRAVNKKKQKSLTRPGLKCTASAKNVVVS